MRASLSTLPAYDASEEEVSDPNRSPYLQLPAAIWGTFAVGALFGLLTPNPLLTIAAIMALPVFMTLLWRPGEPPILLFAVAFQWLQVTARVFQANFAGLTVVERSRSAMVEEAIWLGLAGLVVLSIGMRIGMRWLKARNYDRVARETNLFSIPRAFIFWLVMTVVSRVVTETAWTSGGDFQTFRVIFSLKWVAFFLLGYLILKRKEKYPLLALALVYEFIQGIGFFSGFKFVIFVALITAFTVYERVSVRTIVSGAIGVFFLLIVGSAWTLIKPEFRAFVQGDAGRIQGVAVSEGEKFDKLISMVSDLSAANLVAGIDPLFNRVSYVDYFGYTMEYVPLYTPHEGGQVWKAAILHILQPRFLFPDKPRLQSDSEFTMRYTGLHMASGAQGTSISIGYMGEAYIDFGRWGMFVPILLLGLLWGLMYSYFVGRSKVQLIGFGFALIVLIAAYQFEMVTIKLMGGMVSRFLLLAVMFYFLDTRLGSLLSGGRLAEEEEEAEWESEESVGMMPSPSV